MNGFPDHLSEDEYTELVHRHFDPLAKRLGLHGPVAREFNMEFTMSYFAPRLGLEIQVDRRHWFFPYMTVFTHRDRRQTTDEVVNGRNVRSLGEAARLLRGDCEIHAALKSSFQHRDPADGIARLAARAAEELWPLIEKNPDKLFDLD